MFLRKLFGGSDKIRWLVLELIVIFIGVYLAFALENFGERRNEADQRQKALAALKYELEVFRVQFPGRASYTEGIREQMVAAAFDEGYSDFSDWRFIEPQYEYATVEYALGLQNTNVISFELYDQLQRLYASIRRLEAAERLITGVAESFRVIPEGLAEGHPEVVTRHADNRQGFGRFLLYMGDRASNFDRVAASSANSLAIIDAELDAADRAAIERDLIRSQMDTFESVDQAVELVQAFFPHIPREEIESMYEAQP